MSEYGFTPGYLTKDGKPWFPMMGEIHYSRVPAASWKETLCAMKSGGVGIASAYCIWMHHEQEEGHPDFSGNRNLRRFLQTAAECGIKVLLRIGPWCHGEVRNGGFPDWLLQKGIPLRQNNPRYLALVERYYRLLAAQAEGLLEKDGGPVIGIQLENEYGHVGGLTAEDGEAHMRTLRELAIRCGFTVPLYTATGWGGAMTGGALPVMGGYADAPWSPLRTKLPPSGNFVFTPERNDGNIGSDHGFGYGITYDLDRFPFLTAELGGGLQVTHHRRPVASAADAAAMSVCKMGSGCSMLGYYMYAGGTNPDGRFYPLQESRATGYPNDLPVKSYDFNAPIREFGQTGRTYRELRMIGLFLEDFGADLAPMKPVFPVDSPQNPSDLTHLRYAWRTDGKSGWLFVNNYVRLHPMPPHKDVRLSLPLQDGQAAVTFPPFDVKDGEYFFFPFGLKISDRCTLKTALATPLMRLNAGTGVNEAIVFYGDRDPQFNLDGDPGEIRLNHLSRGEALDASGAEIGGRQYLILSKEEVVCEGTRIRLRSSRRQKSFRTWPKLPKVPEGFVETMGADGFALYTMTEESTPDSCGRCDLPEPNIFEEGRADDITALGADSRQAGILPAPAGEPQPLCDLPAAYQRDGAVFTVTIPALTIPENSGLTDVFLRIHYLGDRMECWHDGRMISDGFFTGQDAWISLRRTLADGGNLIDALGEPAAPQDEKTSSDPAKEDSINAAGSPKKTKSVSFLLKIYAIHPEDPIYLECADPAGEGAAAVLSDCRLVPVFDKWI